MGDLPWTLPGLTDALCTQLWGADDERAEAWLDPAERDARERRTALAADALLRLVEAAQPLLPPRRDLLYQALARWLGLLAKALTDEFVFERDPADQPLSARPPLVLTFAPLQKSIEDLVVVQQHLRTLLTNKLVQLGQFRAAHYVVWSFARSLSYLPPLAVW